MQLQYNLILNMFETLWYFIPKKVASCSSIFFVIVLSLLVIFCLTFYCHQGWRYSLSIGRIISNFTPILPYFQHWGMNLDHDFFQVRKLSEDQKKVFTKDGRLFSPNSSEDQKTAPNILQRSDTDQSQIIGGDADVSHSQITGGRQLNYWGDISPPFSPGFGTPDCHTFSDFVGPSLTSSKIY